VSRLRFAAILDSGYLTRGLVLHQSLLDVLPTASLEIVCMDDQARELLQRLELDGVGVVDVAELEAYDPALVEARPGRSLGEYCWTVKPSLCRFLFDRHPETDTVVYVDADLMFFADPAHVLAELRDRSALVVPHRAPPGQDWEEDLGTYNAGFVAFRRGDEASSVLAWWRERCLEWCYERVEPGRYCDQKYLDEWPRLSTGVHAAEHVGAGLAPWNASAHELSADGGNVVLDGAIPLVFFHFQSFRLYRGVAARLCRIGLLSGRYRRVQGKRALAWSVWASYVVSSDAERLVYAPYARRLAAAGERVAALGEPLDRTFSELGARKMMLEVPRAILPASVKAALRRGRLLPRRREPRPSKQLP
jgi:hypothetical protein